MKLETAFLFLILASVRCDHLVLGEPSGKMLLYHTVAQYNAFPLLSRERQTFYNDPEQRNITSIMAYDNLNSDAKAIVTSGGIGYHYVNILMKSSKGKGLDYDIGVYGASTGTVCAENSAEK